MNASGRATDRVFYVLTGLATLIILAMVVLVVGIIAVNGWDRFGWYFLTTNPLEGMTKGGIFPALFGTCLLVIVMTVAVMPIGAITAIFLHEYARPTHWLTRLIRIAVHNLAGVPSIVFGLFGLGFFIITIGGGLDRMLGHTNEVVWAQPSILWASLTLAVLNLPVVIVSTEEALKTVPKDHRLNALALGATRLQTIARVILPQAMPGILTGAILAVARGAGEVAPVMFTGAAYYLPQLPKGPTDQFMELGYHIYVLSTQSVNIDQTRPLLFATVLALLLLTVGLNAIAIYVRAHFRRAYGN